VLPKYAPSFENNTAQYDQQNAARLRELGGDVNADLFDGLDGATGKPAGKVAQGSAARTAAMPGQAAPVASGKPDRRAVALAVIGRPKGMSLAKAVISAVMQQSLEPEPVSVQPDLPGKDGKPNKTPAAAKTPSPTVAQQVPLTPGGGPEAHHSRALGNWQSDDAYDIMGKTGDPIFAGVDGVVTNISGRPGGDPGFAGYGITVRTKRGNFFFKHLGSKNVKIGQRVSANTLLGGLDAKTAGGPHLHLGGDNRSSLDNLYKWFVAGGRS